MYSLLNLDKFYASYCKFYKNKQNKITCFRHHAAISRNFSKLTHLNLIYTKSINFELSKAKFQHCTIILIIIINFVIIFLCFI